MEPSTADRAAMSATGLRASCTTFHSSVHNMARHIRPILGQVINPAHFALGSRSTAGRSQWPFFQGKQRGNGSQSFVVPGPDSLDWPALPLTTFNRGPLPLVDHSCGKAATIQFQSRSVCIGVARFWSPPIAPFERNAGGDAQPAGNGSAAPKIANRHNRYGFGRCGQGLRLTGIKG